MMNWIKKIDYNKFIKGDLKILLDIIGIDNFIKLYETFAKTAVYFSEKPIMEMKQEYIRKYFGTMNVKELARMLGVSERLIFKVAAQRIVPNSQQNLFEELDKTQSEQEQDEI